MALILISIISFATIKNITKKNGVVTHETISAQKDILINVISGTGQVFALDQIEVKPKIAGKISYINIKNGQKVNRGDLLLQLDSEAAEKDLWNAQINLSNAKISAKDLSLDTTDDLNIAYNNVLNALTNNYKDISNLMPQIKPMFEESSYNSTEDDNNDVDYYLRLIRFIQQSTNTGVDLSYWTKTAEQQYLDIKGRYEDIQSASWALNNQSSRQEIDSILEKTYQIDQDFLDLIRQTLNLTQKYQYLLSVNNITSPISTQITNDQVTKLSTLNSILVNHVNNIKSVKNSLQTAKDSYKKIDINNETQDLNIRRKEKEVADAQEYLSNHKIYASLNGVIASANDQIQTGDQISTSTIVANLVTNQQIAKITLNETDVAKIKLGQKANITFDAIEDLTLTGKVIEIDELATITQGVVTYDVKISFDTQDERLKKGMSLSVDIITDIITDSIVLPISAIKYENTETYVELLNNDEIKKVFVKTGISNDTQTEILSGIKEGDNVITKTTTSSNTKPKQTSTNPLSMPGANRSMPRSR